ncbi:MAG: dehydrogenase [Phycisphaerae bacterium]
MPPLTIALVGCGNISQVHARVFLAHPELIQPAGVCDTAESKAEQRGRQLGCAVRSWDDILKDPAVQAVDLCLPHALHKAMTIEALDAGKHVLLEKPLATTLEEADAMIAAADRSGRVFMVAQCQRFEPENRLIHAEITRGSIGQITMARTDHLQNLDLPAGHWLADRAQAGGGVILGSGVHRIDLLRWFCGEIAEVYCAVRPMHGRLDSRMEVNALALLRHASGTISECAFNWACYNHPWFEMMALYGTQGQIHNLDGVHIARSLELRPPRFEKLSLPTGSVDGFEGEILHFVECIQQQKTPLTDARDNRRTLAAVLACYESARTGQPVAP